jgi:hypothetical protein
MLLALASQSRAQVPARIPSSCNPPIPTTEAAPALNTANSGSNPFATSGTRDERILLPLLLQERMLREEYGRNHPEVRTIQSRIEAAREFLRQHPEPQPAEKPEPAKAAVPPQTQPSASIAPAKFTAPAGNENGWPVLPAVVMVPPTQGGSGLLNLPIVPTAPAPIQFSRPDPVKPVTVPPVSHPNRAEEPKPGATTAPADPRPLAGAPLEASRDKSDGLWLGPWQLVEILAAFLVGLLVHIAALFFIIRRNGEREAVYRVELVNAPPLMAVPNPAHLAGTAEERGLRLYPGFAEQTATREVFSGGEEKPGQEFDLGPTYEEEQRLKEENRRQEEEAMLRHILEQNLHLRTEIAELASAE